VRREALTSFAPGLTGSDARRSCFADRQFQQAIGIALESRRLDKLEQAVVSSGDAPAHLAYALRVCQTLVTSREFRRTVRHRGRALHAARARATQRAGVPDARHADAAPVATKIYVNEILKLHSMKLIKGCAHITGGGIIENIPRVIPDNYSAKINLSKIKTNKVIKWIKSNGVNDHEMLKTFNCGVGFCIIADKKNLKKILKVFNKSSKPYEIGTIIKSNNNKKIILNEKINWKY